MKKNNNLVSIIMPAYNCEKFIEKSIISVINQTYKYWELIIVDDCSKDNTLKKVNKYLSLDARIKLIKNDSNKGVSYSRNVAIESSLGEWIAFLDSDDIWEKEKLELQMNFATAKNAEFIFTGSKFINENGVPYKGIFEVPSLVTFNDLRKHNCISCSSILIKKILIPKEKFTDYDFHEDYALWLNILKNNNKAFGINQPLLIYRISANSKSGNKIKSIFMTYKVHTYLQTNPFRSLLYTMSHGYKSFIKFKKIGV